MPSIKLLLFGKIFLDLRNLPEVAKCIRAIAWRTILFSHKISAHFMVNTLSFASTIRLEKPDPGLK